MRYVLHYYKEGKLDTHRALSKIQARVGTPRHTARHYILRWAAAAASVLVVIGIGTYLYQRPTTTTLTADATQQVYRLPDGTMHHDARHPFTITDNDYIIRDIGTHLQVEESEGITQLTVLEGAASFGSTRSGNTAIALRAGMSATLSQGDSAPRLDKKTDVNQAAWATHEFHFADAPLGDVLHTLSTYYHVRLTASDTGKRLTADFDTKSLNSIITVIEQTLDVKIEKEENR